MTDLSPLFSMRTTTMCVTGLGVAPAHGWATDRLAWVGEVVDEGVEVADGVGPVDRDADVLAFGDPVDVHAASTSKSRPRTARPR